MFVYLLNTNDKFRSGNRCISGTLGILKLLLLEEDDFVGNIASVNTNFGFVIGFTSACILKIAE